MGFALKCNIFELPESGVHISRLKIFDMRLISLDRVTYNRLMGPIVKLQQTNPNLSLQGRYS